MTLPLAKAEKFADRIMTILQPFCDRIEVAGSIRRGRPIVGDIDIVALPKPGQAEALRERVLKNCSCEPSGPNTCQKNGKQTIIITLANGVQLDLWLARPEEKEMFSVKPSNWGMLLLVRTGSKEHNIHLAIRAQKLGRHFNATHGIFKGDKLIASATEEDVFRALDMDFIPPEKRER